MHDRPHLSGRGRIARSLWETFSAVRRTTHDVKPNAVGRTSFGGCARNRSHRLRELYNPAHAAASSLQIRTDAKRGSATPDVSLRRLVPLCVQPSASLA